MKVLHGKGFAAVTLDELLDPSNRPSRKDLNQRVAITFDDGYLDTYSHAFLILEKYGFTATFFLTTNLMGKTVQWPRNRRAQHMQWRHAREALDRGFSFQSHSLSHPNLRLVEDKVAKRELVESKAVIEDNLGMRVDHFAYPYGSYDPRIKSLVAECGYKSAFTTSFFDNETFADLLRHYGFFRTCCVMRWNLNGYERERIGVGEGDTAFSLMMKTSRWVRHCQTIKYFWRNWKCPLCRRYSRDRFEKCLADTLTPDSEYEIVGGV